MRPLFEDCFKGDWMTTTQITSTSSEPSVETKTSSFWLIVVIVIVIIVIILIVIRFVYYWMYERKASDLSDTSASGIKLKLQSLLLFILFLGSSKSLMKSLNKK